MVEFWESCVGPILERLKPGVVVEVGSERGKTTDRLVEFCVRTGATLHAVDPTPQFDATGWPERYGGHAVFHRSTGLAVLTALDRFDAVLIDGDHNWYTVYHELKQIGRRCAEVTFPFPLVLLHDVGWPYGRRDQYYDPESIPEEFRQPCALRGMRPGSPALVERGGFNASFWNAIGEGGPRNGVLTAVEDFRAESALGLDLITIPGFHGLAILVPADLRDHDDLRAFLAVLDLHPSVRRHVEQLEADRIGSALRLQQRDGGPRPFDRWKGRVRRLLGRTERS